MIIAIVLMIKKNFQMLPINQGTKLMKRENTKNINSDTIGIDLINHAISLIETDFV
ncbi:hypothetical protein IJU97_02075 [bacterium]|nr:hypothetical protein [bacterium]